MENNSVFLAGAFRGSDIWEIMQTRKRAICRRCRGNIFTSDTLSQRIFNMPGVKFYLAVKIP